MHSPGFLMNGRERHQVSAPEINPKETTMKKIALVMAIAIGLSVLAFSQDAGSSQSSDNQQGSSAQSQTSNTSQSADQSTSGVNQSSDKKAAKAKLKHLKGTIGQDGKTFTSDKDSKSWTIMNPEAVQGHEGHHVILDAHVYPDKDSVHVMGVKMMGEKGSKPKNTDKSSQPPMSEQPPKR
jgi:hypothetical protein